MSLSPETNRKLNVLAGNPACEVMMDKNDYRAVLLEVGGNMLACGRVHDFVATNMGADIYKVSLRLRNI